MYAFFDGVNVDKWCTPKLLEIKMTSGTFQVGETVTATLTSNQSQWRKPIGDCKFRVCQANHREGPYLSLIHI